MYTRQRQNVQANQQARNPGRTVRTRSSVSRSSSRSTSTNASNVAQTEPRPRRPRVQVQSTSQTPGRQQRSKGFAVSDDPSSAASVRPGFLTTGVVGPKLQISEDLVDHHHSEDIDTLRETPKKKKNAPKRPRARKTVERASKIEDNVENVEEGAHPMRTVLPDNSQGHGRKVSISFALFVLLNAFLLVAAVFSVVHGVRGVLSSVERVNTEVASSIPSGRDVLSFFRIRIESMRESMIQMVKESWYFALIVPPVPILVLIYHWRHAKTKYQEDTVKGMVDCVIFILQQASLNNPDEPWLATDSIRAEIAATNKKSIPFWPQVEKRISSDARIVEADRKDAKTSETRLCWCWDGVVYPRLDDRLL